MKIQLEIRVSQFYVSNVRRSLVESLALCSTTLKGSVELLSGSLKFAVFEVWVRIPYNFFYLNLTPAGIRRMLTLVLPFLIAPDGYNREKIEQK